MSDQPVYAVADASLIPVADYPGQQTMIPPSKMFMIKQGLKAYVDKMGGGDVATVDDVHGALGACKNTAHTQSVSRHCGGCRQVHIGEGLDEGIGRLDHQMAVEHLVGAIAHRLDDRRT